MTMTIKRGMIKWGAWLLASLLRFYRSWRPMTPAIYFCFNQSIHQIYHSLFVAIELSNCQDRYPVVILSTSHLASIIIERELAAVPNRVVFKRIRHPGYQKIDFKVNWFVFWCRLFMDRPVAVVVTDYFDNVFRQLSVETIWLFIPHGLVNREFASHPHIHDYDMVFLPGERDKEELEKRIGPLRRVEVVGYSKFDYFKYHQLPSLQLFLDKKPVILYNPHFEETLSSFFDLGYELLKELSDSSRYHVIFMPHPDLSRRYPAQIERVRRLPHVVTTDRLRINLDYMAAADLYITDVSSSAFEWLHFDRPMIFVNSKRVTWQDSPYYPSWRLGEVAENVAEVVKAIEKALTGPDGYEEIRRGVYQKTFAHRQDWISRRIAERICRLLDR